MSAPPQTQVACGAPTTKGRGCRLPLNYAGVCGFHGFQHPVMKPPRIRPTLARRMTPAEKAASQQDLLRRLTAPDPNRVRPAEAIAYLFKNGCKALVYALIWAVVIVGGLSLAGAALEGLSNGGGGGCSEVYGDCGEADWLGGP